MGKFEVGKVVKGVVSGIENYGVFVKFDEYYSGLIHISEISTGFVRDPSHYVKIGETIQVEVLSVDEKQGQLKLSIKNISYQEKTIKHKKKIVETPHGFQTLAYHLPFWIQENIQNTQNPNKSY